MEKLLSTVYNPRKTSFFSIPGRIEKKVNSDSMFTVKNNVSDAMRENLPKEAYSFISENIDLRNYPNILFTTPDKAYIENLDFDNLRFIVNSKKINNIRFINRHLQNVNQFLPESGIYITRLNSLYERRQKIYDLLGKHIGRLVWFFDFILNRVLPKLKHIGKLYFIITGGKFHIVSSSEMLGRLFYNGFEVIDTRTIQGLTYVVAMKTGQPSDHPNPTYHPLVKLQRVGKDGKLFGVYKLRTMFPYSEYLQDYVVKMNGYNEFGKPANDFRLTGWGKLFRKFWLDEIPQFLNLIRGELAIVGVRPLSKARFKELPREVQQARVKFKPGLIPPYVSLNMPDDKGNIEAERIYMAEKALRPFRTDVKYFFMAVFNILTGKIRSA